MAKRTRFATVCAVALLAFAMLFSVCFIVVAADHDCTGTDCAVCHQIQTCQKMLEQLSASCTASAGTAALCFFTLLLVLRGQNILAAASPVSWKVKLLN